MALFSQRVDNLQSSPIREILSIISQPGMVSFAGGLPATETFIKPDISAMPASLLQYGPSEGEYELRSLVSAELLNAGLKCPPERILILSGSQQGIDLVAKLFVDPGTPVAVESPTYIAALQVLRFYGAALSSFDVDAPELLLENSVKPSFLYAIPTFQNPTGRCYSQNQRENIARFCDEQSITLFEDDPYRDLFYEPCQRTPICSSLKNTSWVYQGSFSKSLAPGLRLGYLACSEDLISYLIRLKQAADLHSNRISQWLVTQQLKCPDRQARMDSLAQYYREKRDYFAHGLEQNFAELASWEIPKGGLFLWLKLRQKISSQTLFREAIKENVAFMPGDQFFLEPNSDETYLRLNFSHASKEEVDRGLRILALCIERLM